MSCASLLAPAAAVAAAFNGRGRRRRRSSSSSRRDAAATTATAILNPRQRRCGRERGHTTTTACCAPNDPDANPGMDEDDPTAGQEGREPADKWAHEEAVSEMEENPLFNNNNDFKVDPADIARHITGFNSTRATCMYCSPRQS
jgi:hypothetical protein